MRPRISAPRALAAGLCLALVAAGCGGGEQSKPAPALGGFKRWAGSDPAEDDVLAGATARPTCTSTTAAPAAISGPFH